MLRSPFTIVSTQMVSHVARRVVFRDADAVEVVLRPLDLGALDHAETEVAEDFKAVAQRLGNRVKASECLGASRETNVEGFGRREFAERSGLHRLLFRFEGRLEAALQGVCGGPKLSALLGRLFADGPEERGDAAVLAAEPGNAPLLDLSIGGRRCESVERFRLQLGEIWGGHHRSIQYSLRWAHFTIQVEIRKGQT
jgi:hypothetical protein